MFHYESIFSLILVSYQKKYNYFLRTICGIFKVPDVFTESITDYCLLAGKCELYNDTKTRKIMPGKRTTKKDRKG